MNNKPNNLELEDISVGIGFAVDEDSKGLEIPPPGLNIITTEAKTLQDPNNSITIPLEEDEPTIDKKVDNTR